MRYQHCDVIAGLNRAQEVDERSVWIFPLRGVAAALLVAGLVACGDETGGEGGSSGTPTSGTGACFNEGCDKTSTQGPGPGSTTATTSGPACPDVYEVERSPSHSGGPQMCAGFEPGACDVLQDGCNVQISCERWGVFNVQIDMEGVSNDIQVALGDGITATCKAELDSPGAYLVLSCSAQGVTCEYTSRIP